MSDKKIKVCLLFGGKSKEHEVSLQSARSVYMSLPKDKYDVVLIGVSKEGRWLLGEGSNYLLNAENPKLIALNESVLREVSMKGEDSGRAIVVSENKEILDKIDIVFPLIHGTYGEDGKLQGFLDMLGVSYVGSGVLGSAVGMDKDVMKRLLRDAGLKIGNFLAVRRKDVEGDVIKEVSGIGYPLFVKPANLGSSVGVSKVADEEGLMRAVSRAFRYDDKVLLEEFIKGREIEVSVLGGDAPKASLPGEVIPNHDFYSYDAKYIDEGGADFKIPADLPDRQVSEVRELAVRVFEILEADDFARVDFFLDDKNEFVVNEINTIPGFTSISMYPKLWGATGVSYGELLDRLIKVAIDRWKEKFRFRAQDSK